MKCIFDTGAQYGYIMNDELLADAVEDGEISDYNPTIGAINSKAWKVPVKIGDITFTERVG